MPTNQGRDEQDAHGNDHDDEALWLDLVARLQEPDDAFLDSEHDVDTSAPNSLAPNSSPPSPNDSASNAAPTELGSPKAGSTSDATKSVGDFDPLGVWQQQTQEPPSESAYAERFQAVSTPRELGPRDYEVDDDEDGFVPPTPAGFSTADPSLVAAWIGAAGGPVLLIVAAVFWREIPILLVIAIVLGFIAGTAYLLFRLPNNRDPRDGDGAVV